ncbi:alpha-N-acetylgalactosamine-specific lectin-like [Styela clava]
MKEKLLIYIGLFAWKVSVVSAGRGEWNAFGSYQYYVSGKGDKKSYDDGESFCKNNDGEMAMIKTSEIQTFIQNQVSAISGIPYGFYIGLNEVGTVNNFIWNDNSELNYTNWYLGEPSDYPLEPCVAMGWWHTYSANLPWYGVKCAANAPTGFVCQRLIGNKLLL